jgi:anti-sigma factor RsiW
MNCEQIGELCSSYLSGELTPDQVRELEAHLRSCPACATEVALQRRVDAELRSTVMAEEVDASAIEQRVRQFIAHTQTHKRHSGWRVVAVIAAGLVLFFMGYRVVRTPPLTKMYSDAAQDHVRTARHREWISDHASVAQLAEDHGIPASLIIGAAPAGFRLRYAKLCRLDGGPTLHLIYTDGKQEVSVFLRRPDSAPLPGAVRATIDGRALHTVKAGSQHLAFFQTDCFMAMVVSDGSAETALSLASSIARIRF